MDRRTSFIHPTAHSTSQGFYHNPRSAAYMIDPQPFLPRSPASTLLEIDPHLLYPKDRGSMPYMIDPQSFYSRGHVSTPYVNDLQLGYPRADLYPSQIPTQIQCQNSGNVLPDLHLNRPETHQYDSPPNPAPSMGSGQNFASLPIIEIPVVKGAPLEVVMFQKNAEVFEQVNQMDVEAVVTLLYNQYKSKAEQDEEAKLHPNPSQKSKTVKGRVPKGLQKKAPSSKKKTANKKPTSIVFTPKKTGNKKHTYVVCTPKKTSGKAKTTKQHYQWRTDYPQDTDKPDPSTFHRCLRSCSNRTLPQNISRASTVNYLEDNYSLCSESNVYEGFELSPMKHEEEVPTYSNPETFMKSSLLRRYVAASRSPSPITIE